MSYLKTLSTMHLDILKEIGNIGAGNAATALSTLLNKKIDMNVPSVSVITFNEMMELAGGPENVIACVFLRIEGDAPGSMYFILSLEQGERFIHQITGDSNFSIESSYTDIAISALQELGNILAGSYLSALSNLTNLNLLPTVPALSIEMAGAVISAGLLELSKVGDYAIVIDTELMEVEQENMKSINGHFFLLPDPDSFETIFSALGMGSNE